MSTSNLSIFPSPPKRTDQNVRRPQLRDVTRNSTELRGLALHLVAQPKIQHANERIQHSADQTPESKHRRKRSSTPNLKTVVEASGQHTFAFEDQQYVRPALRPALKNCTPISTSSSSINSKRTSAATIFTPASALAETPATSYTTHSFDRKHETIPEAYVSDASDIRRDGAASAPPEKMSRAFPPRSQSLRSGKSVAPRAEAPESAALSFQNRSIFPQYDMTKPLSQQKYYPPSAATPPALPIAPILKSYTPPSILERKDSGLSLPPSYECIPEPDHEDLDALWRASTRLGACGGRKIQLSFRQASGARQAFFISQFNRKLFSVEVDKPASKDDPTHLAIQKINPVSEEPQLLSNLSLPPSARSQASYGTCNTPIFPHQAAIDALTAASNSPQAMEIARFDPGAKSKAAETLANEAVGDAHRHYTSELVRTTRARDSVGTVSARYKLQHPIAGELAITVVRSVPTSRIYTTHAPQIKVTIHHPSATPVAITEDSLALASIDFGRHTCMIDLPGILALEAEYMLDTAISALFATAAVESENNTPETMTFAAPPKTAVNEPKKKRGMLRKSKKQENPKSSGMWPLRKTGVREIDDPIEEMPSVAKGALAIIELGIHGAFWALEKGFKSLDGRTSSRQ